VGQSQQLVNGKPHCFAYGKGSRVVFFLQADKGKPQQLRRLNLDTRGTRAPAARRNEPPGA
jgi:hypothetical protein